MIENAGNQGFPKKKLKSALEAHPGSKFGVKWAPEAKFLSQGQTLTYGDYTFACIETPGHTLGHICLYETSKKFLFPVIMYSSISHQISNAGTIMRIR